MRYGVSIALATEAKYSSGDTYSKVATGQGGLTQHVVELQQHRRRVVRAGVAPHVLVEALKAQTPAAETEGLVLTATEEVDLHRPALPDD
jgi:hypothetical protein